MNGNPSHLKLDFLRHIVRLYTLGEKYLNSQKRIIRTLKKVADKIIKQKIWG